MAFPLLHPTTNSIEWIAGESLDVLGKSGGFVQTFLGMLGQGPCKLCVFSSLLTMRMSDVPCPGMSFHRFATVAQLLTAVTSTATSSSTSRSFYLALHRTFACAAHV